MDFTKVKEEGRYLERTLFLTAFVTGILWLVWACDVHFHLNLVRFGIISREVIGLRGLLFSPYIHDTSSMDHILNNTPPFMALFFLLLNGFRKMAGYVFISIQLSSGFMLWLFGPGGTETVGMSGVIFGLATFLIGSGIFRRNLVSIVLAVMVIFYYGGMLTYGAVPNPDHPEISWQGHVCGGVAGLFVAFNFRNYDRAPSTPITSSDDGHFFDRHP